MVWGRAVPTVAPGYLAPTNMKALIQMSFSSMRACKPPRSHQHPTFVGTTISPTTRMYAERRRFHWVGVQLAGACRINISAVQLLSCRGTDESPVDSPMRAAAGYPGVP